MPKVYKLKISPGNNVMEQNLKSFAELQKDKNPQSQQIDNEIKRLGTSPSEEQSLNRHAIVDIINALNALGVDISTIKSFSEYSEYNNKMEEIKEKCKNQYYHNEDKKNDIF